MPEITDAAQLRQLQNTVYEKVSQLWQNRTEITEDVTYQVGVLQNGSLVAYKPVDQVSGSTVAKTPLPSLLSIPAQSNGANREPIAQFRVVFTKRSALQVSPWRGYGEPISTAPTPEITASDKLAELNQLLSKILRNSWKTNPNYPRDLSYRIAMTEQGKIVDFEPLNQPAFDYLDQTPLQTLKASGNSNNSSNQPIGQFQVVFKTTGGLEVSPMRGF
jgi:hypothetical protein